MSELRDRGVFATRQLAKRQITWLRSLPQRTVLEADGEAVLKQALAWVEAACLRLSLRNWPCPAGPWSDPA